MAALTKIYLYSVFLMYDGANGADIVSTYNSNAWPSLTSGSTATLLSDSGGTAVIRFNLVSLAGGSTTLDLTMHTGDLIPLSDNPSISTSAAIALRGSSLSVPGVARYGGMGEAVLGALSVGNTNLTVTIKPAQPDMGYVASAFLDGPALALGTVTLGTPVILSASTVRVPVTNSGVLPVTLSSSTVTVNVTAPQT